MRPKMMTETGIPTAYGFACGLVQRKGLARLHQEHGVYHVIRFADGEPRVWETARTLTEARRLLSRLAALAKAEGRTP